MVMMKFVFSFIFLVISLVKLKRSEEISNPDNNQIQESEFIQSVLLVQHGKFILEALPSNIMLQWGSTCQKTKEEWYEFAQYVIKEGDILIEINPGIGWTFIPLTDLVAPSGASIGLVKDSDVHDLVFLYRNLNNHSLWNQTLMIPHRVDLDSSFIDRSIAQNLVQIIKKPSAHFIYFRYLMKDDDLPIHEFIADSILALRDFSTVMYIEFSFGMRYLREIIELLLIFQHQIYFQPLSCYCQLAATSEDVIIRTGLIVMPAGYNISNDSGGLGDYLKRFYRIESSIVDMYELTLEVCGLELEVEEMKQGGIALSEEESRGRREAVFDRLNENLRIRERKQIIENEELKSLYYELYQETSFVKISYDYNAVIEVELAILIPMISPLRCLLWPEIEKEERLFVNYPLSPDSGMKNYRALFTLECSNWIYGLVEEGMKRVNNPPCYNWRGYDYSLEVLESERLNLWTSCADFLIERSSLQIMLYIRKWNESVVEIGKNLNSTSENDLVKPYMHYDEDLGSASIEAWFERQPFQLKYDPDVCGEPIFCDLALEMQSRIMLWQSPIRSQDILNGIRDPNLISDHSRFGENRTCENVKYLVYEPASNGNGIGSMLLVLASAIRFAICLDRVLILRPVNQSETILKWRPAGCQTNVFECYFEPLSHCIPTPKDYEEALVLSFRSNPEYDLTKYPYRNRKTIIYHGYPVDGPCKLCFEKWPLNSKFFDGLDVHPRIKREELLVQLDQMSVYSDAIKLPWQSQFLRVLIRPRKWLINAMKEFAFHSMMSPATHFDFGVPTVFPKNFISLHVRFGLKYTEVKFEPLSRYMTFLKKKLPYVTDIFVSTETESVIHQIVREYPEYNFHFLRYERIEFLNVELSKTKNINAIVFVKEFLYSLTNLYVAIEANGFIGTLTSNWCVMIQHLERTRGDGGYDYYSMDQGTAFTSCYF